MLHVMNNFLGAQLKKIQNLSKSYPNLGNVTLIFAIFITLSITTYLVISSTSEFINGSIKIAIKRADPEKVYYPPMKFCFTDWVQWVNWTKVEELGFTKHEFLYAASYLSEVASTDIFDIEEVENSLKMKLKHKNITLKNFFEATALRKKVFYDIDNYNYSVKLLVSNDPNLRNIFDLNHILCYIFPEEEVRNLVNEAKRRGSTFEKGYELKIDRKFLPYYEMEHEKHNITKNDTKIFKYSVGHTYNYVLFYPDCANPSHTYLDDAYSAPLIELTLSLYIKKNLPQKGQKCVKGQKSFMLNFTAIEESMEKTRELIFHENNAYEPWIGYYNDISLKEIYFINKSDDNDIFWNLTYTRHHKLENWVTSPEKIKEAYNRMINTKLFNNSANPGCDIWDINFKEVQISGQIGPFMPVVYPSARQILVREEEIWIDWPNFVGSIGGILGILIGASVIAILQIYQFLYRLVQEKILGKKDLEKSKNTVPQMETEMNEQNYFVKYTTPADDCSITKTVI